MESFGEQRNQTSASEMVRQPTASHVLFMDDEDDFGDSQDFAEL